MNVTGDVMWRFGFCWIASYGVCGESYCYSDKVYAIIELI